MKSMEKDLGKESELSEMDLGKNNGGGDIIFQGNYNNSIVETQYLLSSKRNREKLAQSIKQMENGNLLSYNLIKYNL
jgi:hypothetical protein